MSWKVRSLMALRLLAGALGPRASLSGFYEPINLIHEKSIHGLIKSQIPRKPEEFYSE